MSNVQGPKARAFGVAETQSDRDGTAGTAPDAEPREVMRRRLVARLPSSLQDETTLGEWKAWCDCLAACIVDKLISWEDATTQHPIAICGMVYRLNEGRASKLKSLTPKVEPVGLELWQGGQPPLHSEATRKQVQRNAADAEQTVTTSDGCTWPYSWVDRPELDGGGRVLFVDGKEAGVLRGNDDWHPAPPSSAWARPCIVCAGEGCDPCANTGKRGNWTQDSGGACYVPELRDPPNPAVATTSIELGAVSAEKAAELIGVMGKKSDAEDLALKQVEKLLPAEDAGNPMVRGMQAKHLRWLLGRVRSLKENGAALLQRCEHLEQEAASQSSRASAALREVSNVRLELQQTQDRYRELLGQQAQPFVGLSRRAVGLSDRESFLRCTYRELVVHQGEKPRQAARLAQEAWEAIPELLEGE